jgi:hypothetical protein
VGAGCLILAGCDEGKIYPAEAEAMTGGKGVMQVSFKALEAWPVEYSLAFAAFDGNSRLPVISKIIPKPSGEGEKVSVTLNGLDETVRQLSIAVVNKGREPVYDFISFAVNRPEEEITLPVDEIDLAQYDRIQKQVFNAYCIRCHGAGETAAAGMYLTEGNSYPSIAGVAALLSGEGKPRIALNRRPADSFLIDILKEDILAYNHTDVLPEAELVTLIETWVANGAAEDNIK